METPNQWSPPTHPYHMPLLLITHEKKRTGQSAAISSLAWRHMCKRQEAAAKGVQGCSASFDARVRRAVPRCECARAKPAQREAVRKEAVYFY